MWVALGRRKKGETSQGEKSKRIAAAANKALITQSRRREKMCQHIHVTLLFSSHQIQVTPP